MKWSFCFLLSALCFPVQAETIAEAVARARVAPFDHALLMIDVEDDAGNTIFAQNAHAMMIPASVRKLFAMSTVQQCLGNDARFATELWLDGNDVVIKGGGDPSFGSDRYGYDEQNTFAPFIDALRRRGIVRVHDVVADVSLFDRVTLPYQWKLGNLLSTDAAPIDALTFRENAIGDQAVASGGFTAALAFRDALQRAGIPVDGSLRLETEPRHWGERLAGIDSPFLEHLLTTVLKNSQNLYAETLYKRISAGEKPASYLGSRDLEATFLTTEVGIDPAEFRFVDGSGLAPDDLVTPAAIVKMLRWMNAPERRGTWWTVMAEPCGEGTLRLRLASLAGRMHGKTGTVAGVSSLAGFVIGGNGRFRYFAIGFNHHTATSSAATPLLDAIAQAIADF
ncbi:MAG TPA: D-alanyl-D-alanine carboxypeptidase [Thermoanaerobaculia bacterium]|nr:D-alanyl-D-alanine carboxypeptidase [Thermoanaerobaculia bacterium]